MKNNIAIFLLILASSAAPTWGQVSELDFQIKSTRLKISDELLAVRSRIMRQGDQLVWRQRNHSRVRDQVFRVRASEGNWNPETQQGSLTLDLTSEGDRYRFILWRNEEGVRARMQFQSPLSGEIESAVFQVDRIRYQ